MRDSWYTGNILGLFVVCLFLLIVGCFQTCVYVHFVCAQLALLHTFTCRVRVAVCFCFCVHVHVSVSVNSYCLMFSDSNYVSICLPRYGHPRCCFLFESNLFVVCILYCFLLLTIFSVLYLLFIISEITNFICLSTTKSVLG